MDSKLQEKIGTLARRNISRVSHQRHHLIDAVERLKAGEFYYLSDIFDLTHQIAGASGTFGFADVSRTARAINEFVLALEPDTMHTRYDELDSLVLAFNDAVTAARVGSTEPQFRRRRDRTAARSPTRT